MATPFRRAFALSLRELVLLMGRVMRHVWIAMMFEESALPRLSSRHF